MYKLEFMDKSRSIYDGCYGADVIGEKKKKKKP